MIARPGCPNLGVTLATRVQICGRIVASVDGRRIEEELPGRQGRLLFTYLVANRSRPAERDELVEAIWPAGTPAAADAALSALLSKLRRTLGPERLEGRARIRLVLPADAWVDLEAAAEAIHRAESAVARGDWTGSWGPARVAQHVAGRGFLPGEDAPWVRTVRQRVGELYARALELAGLASVGIGGGELATAERAARLLVACEPYRESGYRLLMRIHALGGNRAEGLLVYDGLRRRLRDDLGAAPSTETQELHRELLSSA